ncbi:putative thiamine biosynthetic bifunctional enzyme [Echria macrotheca]|uniref:Thiamine biosynthetic bifunctional enzyme n=1 Tax=Echria macrotheca TaxID=438768 RepID=A0AAJ0F1V7_9PEZI|nr:putative thiamine biosynthetic bifunctional enzyme [Echria macrotheca]
MKTDYALYLVTSSSPTLLGPDTDLIEDVVRPALEGGVTIVQLREKDGDMTTAQFVERARRLLEVTREFGVPLLINDRVDVARAVGCEGCHVGQDDMDVQSARRILGPDAIIGVSASTAEEAVKACREGASYLGIGTVFATSTKKDTKHIIGIQGVRDILAALDEAGYAHIPTVCIGGITQSNVQQVLQQSATPNKSLDGIAVVSAIVGSKDPKAAAAEFDRLVRASLPVPKHLRGTAGLPPAAVGALVKKVGQLKPISHNMTNLVVQNFAANVALAVGASPIMANYGEEAADLCRLGGALVINMGTVTPDGLTNYVQALKAYNDGNRPVIFDPVGAGATRVRRSAVKTIMAAGRVTVIKGNEGEIMTIYGDDEKVQQRGVDSSSNLTDSQKANLVRGLAAREGCVVVMTGQRDFVSDGGRVYVVDNGHALLGGVTGTGCCLGTTISAAVAAVYPENVLEAVMAGILHYEIAAQNAAVREDVRGPGTFVPAFLDELARIRDETARGELGWLNKMRVSVFME